MEKRVAGAGAGLFILASMATPELLARYENLVTQIVNAIEAGEPYSAYESKLSAVRLIVRTIPQSEHNGLRLTPQDLEEMVRRLRHEDAIRRGAGKMRSVPITHREPGLGCDEAYR